MKTFIINLIFLVSSTVLLNAQSITFQLPEIPNPGATVAVPLSVVQCNLGCCQAGAFQIFIEYNPTVLSPIDVNYTNPNLPFYEWSVNLGYSPNLIMVTWLSFTGSTTFQPPEELCEIVFTYTSGCSDLIMTGDGGNCTYIFENGSVGCTYQPEATLSVPGLGGGIPAGSVFFPVTLEEINDGVSALEFYFEFYETVLTPLNVTYPSANFVFYEWSNNLNYGPGEIILTWMNYTGMNVYPEPGEVFCIIECFYTGDPNWSYFSWGTSKGINAYPEKGMTAMWTETGTQYSLTLIEGGMPPILDNVWTGNISNDWFDEENWSLFLVPWIYNHVIIPDVYPFPYPVINDINAIVNKLIIYQDASLIIAPLGNLTTFGDSIIVNGNLLIDCDKVSNCGSLLNLGGPQITGNGMFTLKKNINIIGPTGNINSWHNLASPIDSFSTEGILDYQVNHWDESADEWEIISTGDSCNPILPPTYLNTMESWSVKLNQNFPDTCPDAGTGTIIEFTGSITNLHQGSYSIPFTANTTGYNLLGNPYPSYVDPALINWPTNLQQAIYFKDGWSESYWSWVGGIGPNIPPAQGFFVKATGDGVLTFTGNERVHDSISTNELPPGEKLLSLKVINQENQLFDLTYIRFKEESTPGFDQQWDAYKMFTESPVVPQLYTKSNEEYLSINTIPEASSVPLFFTCRQSGNFTIETSQEENFDEVYLEDLLTGEMNDLLEENYSFNYTSGENQERFVVHFNQTKINEYLNEEINIWLDKNVANIYLPNNVNGTLTVYDLLGHKIAEQQLKSGANSIRIDVPTGVYLTKIVTSHISKSKILFLKSTY